MKRVLLVMCAAAVLLPASLSAQRRSVVVFKKSNPFAFSPYAGVWKNAMDNSIDDENTGWMLGFRVGYDVTRRARFIADVSYAESNNVGNTPAGTPSFNVYDDSWIFTTGGMEYDILPGNTSVTFAAQAGAAWRKTTLDEQIGPTPPLDESDDGFGSQFVVVPRISVRHSFSGRTGLDVSVLDHILPEDGVEHSPALTVGFWFR